jgi:hypothetical protein
MKKIILATLFVMAATVSIYAQCDKRVIIISGKTEYLDADGNVQRSVDENSIVEFDSKEIIITAGDDPVMKGTISSFNCEWKTPFKEGKTVLKTTLINGQGQNFGLTVTVEGKDGKISFLAEIAEQPDRKIRIVVEKFEEKK